MRDFIIEFIEKNNHMIASDIGRNKLIEQASIIVINFLNILCVSELLDMFHVYICFELNGVVI